MCGLMVLKPVMPKKTAKDSALAPSAKTAMTTYSYPEVSSANIAVWVVTGIAMTCTATYWVPKLWRNKMARRALSAGVSAAVACLAQELDDPG